MEETDSARPFEGRVGRISSLADEDTHCILKIFQFQIQQEQEKHTVTTLHVILEQLMNYKQFKMIQIHFYPVERMVLFVGLTFVPKAQFIVIKKGQ